MIYGLYLSAAGVLTNSYRQDVIANNIANAETVGFKKDLAFFQERPTQAQETGATGSTNSLLEMLGGGIFASPTQVDMSQGDLEPSQSNLDLGIEGNGFFAVNDKGQTQLTRDGRFMMDRAGRLIIANGSGQPVLDDKGQAIALDPQISTQDTTIDRYGNITQAGRYIDRIGLFDIADRSKLRKIGGNLISPNGEQLVAGTGVLHGNTTERANVEPTTELTQLMDAQRQLEANANMIRYQDSTLSHAVNEVGKVSG
jgi:flagellar basal body rod protein FlgG